MTDAFIANSTPLFSIEPELIKIDENPDEPGIGRLASKSSVRF